MLRLMAMFGVVILSTGVCAQELSPTDRARVDAAVEKSIATTKVPSVSVGIARGGSVVYAKAFGSARLRSGPEIKPYDITMGAIPAQAKPADASMAYPIGSISKQFTAACILILQERGKLKLDDPVAKWFPDFTRANEVTIRNLLTHTSGYSDYAPQDYTIPAWTRPVDSAKLIREWATKPLDFDPGTKWQYSNTNFQMAALIIQKASGQTYHDFLWSNVITPLKLQGVLDLDTDRARLQVNGYERHALGPMRPAILEAPGWYSGDASLAMPVTTLMAWDESLVHRTLLEPESYDAMFTPFVLKDGTDTHYGLGVYSQQRGDKQILSHSGEVGGFVSNNVVDVTDDVAYAALTNFEGPGASAVTSAIQPIVLPALASARSSTHAKPEETSLPRQAAYSSAPAAQAKAILNGIQSGKLDRALFTADANYYFSAGTLADFTQSLQPLGPIESVVQTAEELRGGMVYRLYSVKFAGKTVSLNTYTQPDGKIEQFLVDESA